MELDSKNLGRLRRVANPRDVWTSEAGDFTPWLAENLDVLGEELGMSLTLVATEVPVGEFRLDIQAQAADGSLVIIENQLERTDHGHLGQCLVYASGLEAATVVWIAPQFRGEFRRALDWLNERTDLGVNFFGVEVGVVQIGDVGPRAPVFDVVARPNDWQKSVKSTGASSGSPGSISALNTIRQSFFAEVLSAFTSTHPSVRMPARSTGNWVSFASGPFGYWALSAAEQSRLRVEAYLDTGDQADNKHLFDILASEAERWEQAIGEELSWERLDSRRASRIAAYRPLELEMGPAREATLQWATQTLSRMFDVLNADLRTRAAEIRTARSKSES